MLLPGSSLNSCNNLSINTQFRKGMKGCRLIQAKITNRLIQANHALLNNILFVCPNEKIRSSLGSDKFSILTYQIIHGDIVFIILNLCNYFFISESTKELLCCFLADQAILHPPFPPYIMSCRDNALTIDSNLIIPPLGSVSQVITPPRGAFCLF